MALQEIARVRILLCSLLLLVVMAPSGADVYRGEADAQAFTIEASPGWERRGPADPSMGLHLRRGGTVFLVRVGPARQSLKGVLTYLRYAVVIRLGGEIFADAPVKIDNLSGQRLVYNGVSSKGEDRIFYRTVLVNEKERLEVVIHAVIPFEDFAEQEDEIWDMMSSFRRVESDGKRDGDGIVIPPAPPEVEEVKEIDSIDDADQSDDEGRRN